MVEIRRLAADEWPRWREMRLLLLKDSPEAFGSTYDETLARSDESWREHVESAATSDNRCILVAEEAGTWLACAGAYASEDDPPGEIWLFTVWTRPEQRGRGLQRRLVEALMAWSRQQGFRRMRLWVTDANTGAQAVYAALGFTPTGQRQLMRDDIWETVHVRDL